MKLLLTSINYSPELTGIGKYNGEMCPELVDLGIQVSAIVAPPYYPEWKLHNGYAKHWYRTEIVKGVNITRCPLYVPKDITLIKRLIHLSSFAFTSAFALFIKLFSKPDVIILVQPTLFCAPFVLLLSKLCGAKTVMHIQDYEVDAMFGLNMMGDGRLASCTKAIEKWLTNKFDAVSTISYSMINNAKLKGVEESKIIYFPNWSDTAFVTPETNGDRLKQEWGFEASDEIILYAGNIGEKQGLEMVLEAAKHFEGSPSVKFVLVGVGARVEYLMKHAVELELNNLHFKPLQPWERVPEMLALAKIHLVMQKKGAADAVLPSKLSNILSAGGHALITAEPNTELTQLSQRFPGIFRCVEPENTDAFISELKSILASDISAHNTIARQYAEDYLAKDKILNKYVADLRKLIA